MITEFLSLLCLGLCLGNEDEENNEKLPEPFLHALPSSEVAHGSNVTLMCHYDARNGTFMLGKSQGNQKESKPAPEKTDTRVVFGATFSCLSLFLLFLAVFFIYRCTQQDSSEEESIKRTCHSKVRKQRDADVPMLERISESLEEPEGVTYAQLNTTALSRAASVPAEETPSSCDYTTVKV